MKHPVNKAFYLMMERLASKESEYRFIVSGDFYSEVWYFDPKTRVLYGSYGSEVNFSNPENTWYEVHDNMITIGDGGEDEPWWSLKLITFTDAPIPLHDNCVEAAMKGGIDE